MARRTKSQTIVAALKSWDHNDEQLACMADPLKQAGPSDEVVALWERNFLIEISKDHEYWSSRTPIAPTPQHISDINTALDNLFPPTKTINGKQSLTDRVFGALLGRKRS